MDQKNNNPGKVTNSNVLQPLCYRTYKEVASLSAVKLKKLCQQYNVDTSLPKKAKIVFVCQRLGISTTGTSHNIQQSRKTRTFDSLSRNQCEELEQLKTKILRGLPSSKWTTDITKLPEINDVSIKRYLLDTEVLDKSSSRTYKLSRPYQLKSSVHSVKYSENIDSDTFGILTARCNSSQSSNPDEVKVLFVVLDKITGEPYSGFCTCTVGFSETCGHVGAALFLVAELVANGEKHFTNSSLKSCTDKLCGWAEPKGSHVEPDIFENFKIKKETEKQQMRRTIDDFGKKVLAPEPPSYDAVAALHANLINATHHMGQYCPAVHVLNPGRFKKESQEVTPAAIHLEDTLTENSPMLAYSSEVEITSTPLTVTRIVRNMFHSVSEPGFETEAKNFTLKAATHTSSREEIDAITVGQSGNPEWKEQRIGCITATKFHKVIKTVENAKENPSLVKEIVNSKDKDFLSKVPSIKWGRTNESNGKKMYIQKMSKFHTNLQIKEHGLMVSKELNFVRGSPDGIVMCKCHSGMGRLLEIKCPYSARDMTVEEGISNKSIKYLERKNNIIELKKNSPDGYYAQIQGLLGITGLSLANLVVWTKKDCKIIAIKFDEDFYRKKLLPACVSFFLKQIAPALLISPEASQNMISDKSDTLNIVPDAREDQNENIHEPIPSISHISDSVPSIPHISDPVQTNITVQTPEYKCNHCRQLLPDGDNVKEDNSNASVGCDCPKCECDVWMCWPCARYTEEWKIEQIDWFCPDCTRDCELVY